MKNTLLSIFVALTCLLVPLKMQSNDQLAKKVLAYTSQIKRFLKTLPQERVYIHMDNNGYYQNDQIWFKAYQVNTGLDTIADLSRTLYVELLTPGGIILDKRVLKVENGQCHGEFKLNQLPFYSGFYEIRAYTKYMLSYGDDIIYRRVFPVFDAPKKEGNFEQKEMETVSKYKYDYVRPQNKKQKVLNLKLYPEGGTLIKGLESKVAFEVTDKFGNPVDSVTGKILTKQKQVLQDFNVTHEGKGYFIYTPNGNEHKVQLQYMNKSYRFDFPDMEDSGYTMQVDNLKSVDSLYVRLQRTGNLTDEQLGLIVLNKGKIKQIALIAPGKEQSAQLTLDKSGFESGTAWVVLFNQNADIIADRLIFVDKPDQNLQFSVNRDKGPLRPFAPVDLGVSLKDANNKPVQTTFSLAVRDAENHIARPHTIQTDLLLMSEIRGFVRNPEYYFDERNADRLQALDLLLMVQGWNRYYPWKMMTDVTLDSIRYMPETGIETKGRVVSMVKQTPKPNVDVSFLLHVENDSVKQNQMYSSKTDENGRFALTVEGYGKMPFLLNVREKGKKKNYRIILDRVFSPEPSSYALTDLQYEIKDLRNEDQNVFTPNNNLEENLDSIFAIYEDSLKYRGIDEKMHRLKQVDVKAKKRKKESDVYRTKSTSVAYYDMVAEIDKLIDQGEYTGDNLGEILRNINPKFAYFPNNMMAMQMKGHSKKKEKSLKQDFKGSEGADKDEEDTKSEEDASYEIYIPTQTILYKNKPVLFVINNEAILNEVIRQEYYRMVRVHAIKSIYVNETSWAKNKYCGDSNASTVDIDQNYGCVVFIDLYPRDKTPVKAGKGTRKTWIEGYQHPSAFNHPDYSTLPLTEDYRRTLYWNPMLTTDESGKANIRFYNNSRCEQIEVHAEALTLDGRVGSYKE